MEVSGPMGNNKAKGIGSHISLRVEGGGSGYN